MASKNKESTTVPQKWEDVPEIPKEEQPYPLPGGWKWVYWGNCGVFIAGNAFKKDYQFKKNLQYPFYKVGSLKHTDQEGYIFDHEHSIDKEIQKNLKASIIPKYSLIFAKIGEAIRLNRRCITIKECCIDNNLMAFIPTHVNNRFIYYWSLSIDLYQYANATTVPAIRKSDLEKIILPLPPLETQQRIVNRIESLFSKLDEAAEKVQAVIDSHEARKQAILHKAFSGELTQKWREENNININTWVNKIFGELVNKMQLGLIKSKTQQGSAYKYKYIKMNNITPYGHLILQDIVYVDATPEEVNLFKLNYGDFLFNTRNSLELVGKNTVFDKNEENILFNNNIMRVKFYSNINPFYISYYLNSNSGKEKLTNIKKNTTNVCAIYAKDLNKLQIKIPSLIEQNEIVRILKSYISQEINIEYYCKILLSKILLLKKYILEQAFSAKLC